MNERFDLVFKGELVPGCDLAQTKSNIANLFKISPSKVEALFSGRAVVLKRNLDSNAANTYRVAIKKAGARVNLVEAKPASSDGVSNANSGAVTSSPKIGAVAVDRTPVGSPVTSDASGSTHITVQAAGEDLLKPEERGRDTVVIEIDLSHLSVRDLQGYLVDFDELEHDEAVTVEVPEVGLSGLDEPLLKPEERSQDVPPSTHLENVDLSVAEPGARLSEHKETNTQAPNTDHITLAETPK